MGMGELRVKTKGRKTMEAATRDKKSRGHLHKFVLLSAISGMALVFMICQATPTQAATMEDRLNDFLRGPPFEFGSTELQPAGEAANTETLQPLVGLPPSQSTSTEPTLKQIKEFAEAVRGDTYASPGKDAARYAFGPRQTAHADP
jgi:hypothetical protein